MIENNRLTLDVCMLGARGVGKTSVLTSIFDEFRISGVAGTKLTLSPKEDTRMELSRKKASLLEVFDNRVNISDTPSAGIEASSSVNTFNFEFGILGKRPNIDLNITDYPGEYLVQNKEFVNEYIAKSTAVIIAIDTPYLMEEDGVYNEDKNQVSLLHNYLKENIDTIEGGKLIMFVPLKCEKYFAENRMEEVKDRVLSIYKQTLDLIASNPNIAVVITPIQTMGDVVFDKFNSNNVATYKFKGDNPQFKPLFCIQPIYYLLSFVAKQYHISVGKKSQGIWGKITSIFNSFFSNDKEMLEQVIKVSMNRLDGKMGYSILSGENLFYSK